MSWFFFSLLSLYFCSIKDMREIWKEVILRYIYTFIEVSLCCFLEIKKREKNIIKCTSAQTFVFASFLLSSFFYSSFHMIFFLREKRRNFEETLKNKNKRLSSRGGGLNIEKQHMHALLMIIIYLMDSLRMW